MELAVRLTKTGRLGPTADLMIEQNLLSAVKVGLEERGRVEVVSPGLRIEDNVLPKRKGRILTKLSSLSTKKEGKIHVPGAP